jgi:hypothetical protein
MTTRKDPSADVKIGAAKSVGVDVSASELTAARKDGAIEAEKEAAKDSYRYATDGNLAGDPDDAPRQFPGMHDIMQFEPLLRLGVAEFEDAVSDKSGVPEEKVAGLLELERSGQNRTPYVQALCKRLKVKSPYEVTGAGPGYTNDIHPITEL